MLLEIRLVINHKRGTAAAAHTSSGITPGLKTKRSRKMKLDQQIRQIQSNCLKTTRAGPPWSQVSACLRWAIAHVVSTCHEQGSCQSQSIYCITRHYHMSGQRLKIRPHRPQTVFKHKIAFAFTLFTDKKPEAQIRRPHSGSVAVTVCLSRVGYGVGIDKRPWPWIGHWSLAGRRSRSWSLPPLPLRRLAKVAPSLTRIDKNLTRKCQMSSFASYLGLVPPPRPARKFKHGPQMIPGSNPGLAPFFQRFSMIFLGFTSIFSRFSSVFLWFS